MSLVAGGVEIDEGYERPCVGALEGSGRLSWEAREEACLQLVKANEAVCLNLQPGQPAAKQGLARVF